MRNLIDKLRAGFTPVKALMLIVCVGIFLFVTGFILYNLYQFYFAGGGDSSVSSGAISYVLSLAVKTGVV